MVDLNNLFWTTFKKFLIAEAENIAFGVNERCLCGRLAIYLEQEKEACDLIHYYADVEYNRQWNGKVKVTKVRVCDEQIVREITTRINCDLILHSRGILEKDNLIAIEMKKSNTSLITKNSDKERLLALTTRIGQPNGRFYPYGKMLQKDREPSAVCDYEVGFFIELDPKARTWIVNTFRSGETDIREDQSGRF